MRDNETVVKVNEAGRYEWNFEPDYIQQLRAEAMAIQTVDTIHRAALVTANAERKASIERILQENSKELDRILEEYERKLEEWKKSFS